MFEYFRHGVFFNKNQTKVSIKPWQLNLYLLQNLSQLMGNNNICGLFKWPKTQIYLTVIFLLISKFTLLSGQQVFPNTYNSDSLYMQATNCIREGNNEAAIAVFNQFTKSDPLYYDVMFEKLICMSNLKKLDEAEAILEETYKYGEMGNFPKLYILYGNILTNLKKYDKALELFFVAEKTIPKSSNLNYNIALTYIQLSENQKAIEYLKKAIHYNPNHNSAHYMLGLVCLDEGKIVEGHLALLSSLINGPNGENAEVTIRKLNVKLSQNYLKTSDVKPSDGGDNFEELEAILRNQLPLNPKYKIKSEIDEIFTRDFQAIVEYCQSHKIKDGFFEQTYVPWLADIGNKNHIESATYYMLSSLKELLGKKITSKNNIVKDFEENYINTKLWSVYGKRKFPELDDQNELMVLLDDDGWPSEIGKYVDGKAQGKYYITNNHGQIISALLFKDNALDGIQNYFYENGLAKEISTYKMGVLEGPQTMFFNSGNLKEESNYKDGKYDGKYQTYYPNGGKEFTGNYIEGNEEGLTIGLNPDGSTKLEMNFSQGKPHGLYKKYDASGDLLEEMNYENGEINGEVLGYFGKGIIKTKNAYKNGKLHGIQYTYNEDKSINSEQTYEEGNLVSTILYAPHGVILQNTKYNKSGEIDFVDNYELGGEICYTEIYKNNKPIKIKQYKGNDAEAKEVNIGSSYMANSRNGLPLITGNLSKGLFSGTWRTFYQNGALFSIQNFENGLGNGTRLEYDRSGILKNDSYYKEGSSTGKISFYESGHLNQIDYYENETRSGPSITFGLDSMHLNESYFTDGNKENANWAYYPSGKMMSKTKIINNYETENTIWDEQGNVTFTNNYYNRNGLFLDTIDIDGTVTESNYINGVKNGKSIAKNNLGDVLSELSFVNNVTHGNATYYNPNGTPMITLHFESGKAHGDIVQYDLMGKLKSKSASLFGVSYGKYSRYFGNGKIMTNADMKKDQEYGKKEIYNMEGKLLATITYLNGFITEYSTLLEDGEMSKNTSVSWGQDANIVAKYTNGKIALIFEIEKNVQNGEIIIRGENGKDQYKTKTINGQLEGERIEYHGNGQAYKIERFTNDLYHGLQEYYDEKGDPIILANYQNDQLSGEFKIFKLGKLEKTKLFKSDHLIGNK